MTENNPLGLLWWKCDSMQPFQLFSTYKAHTGLGINDSMVIVRQWDDPQVCLQHVLYQQYYKGLLLEGAEFREHFDSAINQVILSNGQVVEGLVLDSVPVFNEENALSIALSYVNADTFAWENDSMEYYLQLDSIPEMTTYYPQGELLYALIGDRTMKPENFRLAWRFRIFAIAPHYDYWVYVNAINGEILKETPLECSGTFNHVYYGSRYLDTRWYGGARSKYFLQANDNGRNILTKDDNNFYGSWGLSKLPDDKDDNWGNDNWGATSSHHVVQEAWAMFQYTYGRNGFNNQSKEIRVHGNDASKSGSNVNAQYVYGSSRFDRLIFGSTSAGNLLATYDIAGHEFTHGVDNHTGKLVYELESGALDESFADIFGLMTERYARGTFNWTIGEDANFTLRDLQMPSNFGDPNWYLTHPNWVIVVGCTPTSANDNCGVHTNSGVQNRYFRLLSLGGTQLSRWVQGVGIDVAANVTYYSFTNLTGSTETYPRAREHAIAAARILYGQCSFVENQVCRAWSACNIGPYCEPCAVVQWPCWTYGCGNSQAPILTINNMQVEDKIQKIIVYPNPAEDIVTINFTEFTLGEISELKAIISISDMFGRTIINIPIDKDSQTSKVDISSLNAGVYFLTLDMNGIGHTFKIIKK